MYEVNMALAKVMAPPAFPKEGRLPGTERAVGQNYGLQMREANRFKQSRDENGRSQHAKCCQAVHISLFFDGTNNNEPNDTHADSPHPTNIARLFHASIQGDEAKKFGYFAYYMPGVGTPFPKVGEMDYDDRALRDASGGEDRINWALIQVASALSYAITKKSILDPEAKEYVEKMGTSRWPLMIALGDDRRRQVMEAILKPLALKLQTAPLTPKPLAVKLYVYGFSRG
ncbi:DUF2235 domain-containing protein, partial [Pseudomonas guariconensis]